MFHLSNHLDSSTAHIHVIIAWKGAVLMGITRNIPSSAITVIRDNKINQHPQAIFEHLNFVSTPSRSSAFWAAKKSVSKGYYVLSMLRERNKRGITLHLYVAKDML